jgi:hypothetical protein
MKRKNKETRDRLLVENYIAQKMMGRKKIVHGLAESFSLSAPYIYKLIAAHQASNPKEWETMHVQSAQFHVERLGVSNAIVQERSPRRWWKRLLNKLF